MIEQGVADIDWETAGQLMLRHDVAKLAERWRWPPDQILALPVRTRRSYCYRVNDLNHQQREAARK
jgi:hypothetical protein